MIKQTCIPLEKQLGIEYYLTDTKGIEGVLRKRLEDFIVEEILPDQTPILSIIDRKNQQTGEYTHCILKKQNWATVDAIKKVARVHKVGLERIAYAGIKDKKSISYQRISLWNIPPDNIFYKVSKGIEILYAWKEQYPVTLGDLWGNKFTIFIRDVNYNSFEEIHTCMDQINSIGGVPNYFGYQRFGVHRPITHIVGKMILKNMIENAIKYFLGEIFDLEGNDAKEGRLRLKEDWNFKKALSYFPKRLKTEIRMLEYLAKKPNDYIGAFLNTPRAILKMFVHAYQSYLFNRFLSCRIAMGLPLNKAIIGDLVIQLDENIRPIKYPYFVKEDNIDLINKKIANRKMSIVAPLVGFSTKFPKNEWGDVMLEILERENIKLSDFKNTTIKIVRSKGSYREIIAPVFWEILPTVINNDVIKVVFSLKSATYATIVLREFMKTNPIYYV